MKKFLLTTMFIAAFGWMMNAQQVWDFNGDLEGWIKASQGTVLTAGDTYATLSIETANKNNPALSRILIGHEDGYDDVHVSDYTSVEITLKNNNTDGPIELYLSIPDFNDLVAGKNRTGVAITITNDDADFKTYTIDMSTDGNWTDSENHAIDIKFQFRAADGATYKSQASDLFLIDKIELVGASTGIKSEKTYKLSVAPNPSSGLFKLQSEKAIAGYTVFNTVGQVVKQANSLNSVTTTVDIANSPKGLYFIKVNYQGEITQVVQALVK